ncbi:MAG: cysteine desulfurase family protein [Patescibacteria group bacterium]
MKRVYLDNAAATKMDPRVRETMKPYFVGEFGNAGGLYQEGRRAKKTLDDARESIARNLGARAEEIIFTSGGTESDNLAIFGVADAVRLEFCLGTSFHIITTKFEHHAVLEPVKQLEKKGFNVTYLDVGSEGIINPNDVRTALRPETILVTIMYANNEIGTIQPIREISKIIKEYRTQKHVAISSSSGGEIAKWPYFHTDACQASGYLDTNVNNLGVDLMTINGSKIYGPKGIGLLYRRMGTKIKPMIYGGNQEMRLRAGTENISLIVGLAKAIKIVQEARITETKRLTSLRDYFIFELQKRIPKVVLNGHATKRLPNNINVSILDIEGESLLLYCDAKGISFSTGSACTSDSLDPSHVILALGKPYEFAHSSMRFTLGRDTTKEDIDYVLAKLPTIVERLRVISPIKIDINAKSISHPEAFAGKLKGKAKGRNYK